MTGALVIKPPINEFHNNIMFKCKVSNGADKQFYNKQYQDYNNSCKHSEILLFIQMCYGIFMLNCVVSVLIQSAV